MALRTDESLQKLFQESRLRQQKLREQKKQQSLQRLKLIYHHQDVILKKSLQEERKKAMEQLQALTKQTQQNEKEPPFQTSYKLYQGNEIDEDKLFQTVEELKEWEKTHWNCINWDVWEKLINDTKTMLNQSI